LLQAIYTGKTLFSLGTKEPSQKKRLLAYNEHLTHVFSNGREEKGEVEIQLEQKNKRREF
jgi:hypothetical protein